MTPGDPAFWSDWLRRQALPLWSGAGFDAESGSFVERLALDGSPQQAVPRRVMVQARQIHVYVTAALHGWDPSGADLAFRAAETMIARYHRPDGRPGWVFACTRDGAVADARRDLYAHAFVLLALATLLRLDPRPHLIALVHETLAFLDRALAHPAGGYAEQLPAPLLPRRQNPHMHLFEALLALHEGGACGDLRDRIAALLALFDQHFLPGTATALAEYYDDGWNPVDPAGTFEPGHHFEWVWLLRRATAGLSVAPDRRIERLLRRASEGIDAQGRVVDRMGPRGPVAADCRLWPSMEAAKALAVPQGGAAPIMGAAPLLTAAWQAFCAPATPGGWIDRVDPQGRALVDHMPASTLYHICTAVAFLEGDADRSPSPVAISEAGRSTHGQRLPNLPDSAP